MGGGELQSEGVPVCCRQVCLALCDCVWCADVSLCTSTWTMILWVTVLGHCVYTYYPGAQVQW